MLSVNTFIDAVWFAIAGAVVAAVMMGWHRETRRTMVAMLAVVVVGLIGAFIIYAIPSARPDGKLAVAVREFVLFIIAFGLIRVFFTFLFQGVLARFAMPRILTDLLLTVALIVYLLVRVNASGVDLTAIAVPSSVIGAALAFSLQATLGNLWGGIALQLDNTARIGDWIRFEGVTGQIVGIRWRYLAIATTTNETVIIPNAKLVNNHVHVLGRRGDFRVPLRHTVPFAVVFSVPPSRVIAYVREALLRSEIPTMATDPEPQVVCTGFDDNGIQYGVNYWLTDLARDMATDSEVRVHIYAALERHGLDIPYPHRVLMRPHAGSRTVTDAELDARQEALGRVALFSGFTVPERRALASELVTCRYVNGDTLSRQGDVADCLYLLAEGSVGIFGAAADGGARPRLATLTAPDYFGEMGVLTGQPRTATVVAEGDVVCYRLDKPGFDAIIKARPALIDGLSAVITERQAANDKTLATLSAEARARQNNTRAAELVRRIRLFFEVN